MARSANAAAADVARLTVVADATRGCSTVIWGFGVGGCLAGLVRAGTALRRQDLVQEVLRRIGPSLHRPADPTDHLISVQALLALRSAVPDVDIRPACERWVAAVLHAERPVPGRPRVHRPDLDSWRHTIWVDCLHTDGPGLALLGYGDEAIAAVEEYAAALQRADGLFDHGYDVVADRGNGVAWGRGQGWALLGLVDTLEVVRDAPLRDRLGRLVEALARYERDGRWGTVIDRPDAPVENSVGAYVGWAVGRAVTLGLVDSSYGELAERAYAATLSALTGGGLEVSAATPVASGDSYLRQPTGVYAWGQAPVLHALLDRLEERP